MTSHRRRKFQVQQPPEDKGVAIPSFLCVVTGDRGTGKTSLIRRHISGEFEMKHAPTIGVRHYAILLNTNRGPIRFVVRDTPGNQMVTGFPDKFYHQAQCAILMYEVNHGVSYKGVPGWYRDIVRVCRNIPIALCGNKVDLQDSTCKENRITCFSRKYDVPHYAISAKSHYNIEKPFVSLASKLLGDPNLELMAAPAPLPPEVTTDPELQAKLVKDMKQALNALLPGGDYDDF